MPSGLLTKKTDNGQGTRTLGPTVLNTFENTTVQSSPFGTYVNPKVPGGQI